MPTTTNKGYELQTTGSNAGTWGQVLNDDVFSVIDNNMGGELALSLSSLNVTLTSDQAQNMSFVLSGTLSTNVQINFPQVGSFYYIDNQTSGAFSVTISNGVGTTLVVPQSQRTAIVTSAANGVRYANQTNLGQIVATTGDRLVGTNGSGTVGVVSVSTGLQYSSSTLAIDPTTFPQAGDSTAGIIETAIKSEMEAASSALVAVTPARTQYHPGVSKANVNFVGNVTSPTLGTSYNVSSVTRASTGDYTVNFTTAFANANYVLSGFARYNGGAGSAIISSISGGAKTTSAIRIQSSSGSGLFDTPEGDVAFFGTQ